MLSLFIFLQLSFAAVPAISTVSTPPVTQFALTAAECKSAAQNFFAIPTWYKYLPFTVKTDASGNPHCAVNSSFFKRQANGDRIFDGTILVRVLLAIVDILLRIAALVAVGYVMYGGFVYTTSQGNPDGIRRGQSVILNALIGLVIAILATAMVGFIGSRF